MPTPITQQEYDQKINNYYKYLGKNPLLVTPEEKAANPYVRSLNERFTIIPDTETAAPITKKIEEVKAEQVENKAWLGEAEESLKSAKIEDQPFDYEKAATGQTLEKQEKSRQLTTGSPYAEDITESTVAPIETQTDYLVVPEGFDAWRKQVSSPDTTGTQFQFVDTAVSKAGEQAIGVLNTYWINKDPNYAKLSDKERAVKLNETVKGLSQSLSGKGPVLKGAEPEPIDSALSKQVTKATIPDLSEDQMVYLDAFRGYLAKEKYDALLEEKLNEKIPEAEAKVAAKAEADAYVKGQLGNKQWWQDSSTRREMLSKAPEFKGLLGFGVEEYPSGATIESTPSYVARMITAPANWVVGATASQFADVTPQYKEAREKSDLGAAANVDQLDWWDRTVTRARDNVAKNRGLGEEAYDLAAAGGGDAMHKGAAYALGTIVDVVAMPIVPGLKPISKGAKALALAGTGGELFGDLAKVERLTKAEKLLGNIPDLVPGDLRLLAANNLIDIQKGLDTLKTIPSQLTDTQIIERLGKELGAEHPFVKAATKAADEPNGLTDLIAAVEARIPAALSSDITTATKAVDTFLEAGHAGLKGSPVIFKDIARWTQSALYRQPSLEKLVENTKGLDNIVRVIASNPEGAKAIRDSVIIEKSLGETFSRAKNPGTLHLLTARTAVSNAQAAEKVLSAARETPVSRAIQEAIASGPTEELKLPSGEKTVISGPATTSMIRLNDSARQTIGSYLSRMTTGDTNWREINAMVEEVSLGNISTNTARKLITMQIDDVARRLYAGKVIAIGSETTKNLPTEVKHLLAKPLELRPGYVRRQIDDLATRFTRAFKADPKLSLPAQETFNLIQQELAAMDKTLAVKLKQLVEDERVWRLYGFTDAPTEREAFLALIFKHPSRSSTASTITGAKIAHLARDLVLHNRTITSKLADYINPIKISLGANLDRFTDFRQLVDKLTTDLGKALDTADIESTAQLVFDYMTEINKAVKENPELSKAFATVDPTGSRLSITSNHERLLSAIYFELEKDKILDYNLVSLLDNTAPQINPKIIESLNLGEEASRKIQDMIVAVAKGKLGWTLDDQGNVIASSLETLLHELDKPIAQTQLFQLLPKDKLATAMDLLRELKQKDSESFWRLMNLLDGTSDEIIKVHGLAQKSFDEQVRFLDKLVQDPRFAAEAGLDPAGLDTVKALLSKSYDSAKFMEYMKTEATTPVLNVVNTAISNLKATQYGLMLSLRARFHGMNFLTAPFIMMSTLGGETAATSMRNWLRGANAAGYVTGFAEKISTPVQDAQRILRGEGAFSDAVKANQVAVVDPAGRAYTWRDLGDIARNNGILRTQVGFDLGSDIVKQNARLLLADEGVAMRLKQAAMTPGRITDYANSFAEFSDGSYRMSVLISSLEAGDNLAVAVQKARSALYDYGKITDWERKYIANWFIFYSFTRQAAINVLENALSNPTRLANQLKLAKGFNAFGDDPDKQRSYFYEPEYMRSKPLIAVYNGIDKGRYASYLPSLPPVDAIMLVTKVLSGGLKPSEITTDRFNPLVKGILGLDQQTQKMILEQGYIDPRHVAWLKATGAWDTFEALTGDIEQVKAKEGEPSWNGYKYTFKDNGGLVNKRAAQNYLNLYRLATGLGASTLINDYAPLVAPFSSDLTSTGIELDTSLLEQLGVTTDTRLETGAEIQKKKRENETSENKSLKAKQ